MWSEQSWDSELLQVEVVRLNPPFGQLELAEQELLAFGECYAFAKITADDPLLLQRFQQLGYAVISNELELELLFSRSQRDQPPKRGGEVKFQIADIVQEAALRDLASRSFALDRFHADPTISSEVADRSRSLWVATALKREDAVVWTLVLGSGEIGGLAVCSSKGSLGRIELICVGQEFRRRGYGRALCEEAFHWWKSRTRVCWARTTTQVANLPALRMYLSLGFKPIRSTLVVRKWVLDE